MIEECGDPTVAGHPMAAEILFERLKMNNPFEYKGGSKIAMNRFMGAIKKGEEETTLWSQRRLFYTIACLEQDYFQGSRFMKFIQADMGVVDKTTSAKKRTDVERSLTKSCQNQLVVACSMLDNLANRTRQRIVNTVCKPAKEWFEAQATKLRSCPDSYEWLGDQLMGDFFAHLNQTVNAMQIAGNLRHVGFFLESMDLHTDESRLSITVEQDEFANNMGTLSLYMVASRLARCMWMMVGWSSRSRLFLNDDNDQAYSEIKSFEEDFNAFRAYGVAVAGAAGPERRFHDRSIFHTVLLRQLVAAMQSCEWDVPDERVRAFLEKRFHRLMSTQLIEDAFQRQKVRKQGHSTRAVGLVENFDILRRREVLTSVHHYKAIDVTTGAPVRTTYMKDEVFEPAPGKCSVDCKNVTTLVSSTTYYSPSATRHAVKYGDIFALRDATRAGTLNRLPNLFLGSLATASNLLILRRKASVFPDDGMVFFALDHLPASVALAWVAVKVEVPGHPGVEAYVPSVVEQRYCPLPITDLKEWEAVTYVWRSPSWQRFHFRGVPLGFCDCIRAIVPEGTLWKELSTVAAHNAFWKVSKEKLLTFSTHFGLTANRNSSLFAVLMELIQHILGCSESDANDYCKLRVAAMEPAHMDLTEELETLDESSGVMEKQDEEAMRHRKIKEGLRQEEFDCFFKEWQTERVRISGGSGSRKDPAVWSKTYPLFPTDMVKQSELKYWLPPCCSIWTGFSNGGWHVHLQGWRRKGFKWSDYGHNGAAHKALEWVWERYLLDHRLTTADCPVPFLFGGTASSSSGSAPASSSGVAPVAKAKGKAKGKAKARA